MKTEIYLYFEFMYVCVLNKKKYNEGFYESLFFLPRILFFFSIKRHPLEVIPTPYQGKDMIFELEQQMLRMEMLCILHIKPQVFSDVFQYFHGLCLLKNTPQTL